jgi:hypothetical protein
MATWTIWVGGVEINDHYLTEVQARRVAQTWKNDGYTDVVVEEIK